MDSDSDKPVESLNDSEQPSIKSNLSHTQRDVAVSTVVRLMGLATSTEVAVLEQKIDMLIAKLNTISTKVDRLNNTLQHGSDFDRIDMQLADLRSILKNISSTALSGSGSRRSTNSETQDET